jgi:HK97 gp10 family phage protein
VVTRWRWDPNWRRELTDTPGFKHILDRAGDIVEAGAKRRAPVSPDGSGAHPPGWMRDHIRHEVTTVASGPRCDIISPASYSLYVEYGTKPHIIKSHGDYPLRDRHGRVFGKIVRHPGTSAQPFLRPALDDLAGRRF